MSWRKYLRRRRWHRERAEELAAYLEEESAAQRARGLAPRAARMAAERQLGEPARVLEEIYAMNTIAWWETLVRDARLGIRLAWRSPGFSLAAVALLALGIGASTAVFSVVEAVLLRTLPYPQPNQIVMVLRPPPAKAQIAWDDWPWGVNDYFVLAKNHAFQSLAAMKPDEFNLTGQGDPVRLDGVRTTAGFWATMGVGAALGRTFTAEEDRPGREGVVVLGNRAWREHFAADPRIVGKVIHLNGLPVTVVGVMPAGFDFPSQGVMPKEDDFAERAQLWVPLAPAPPLPNAPDELAMMARLAPGLGLAQAQAAMAPFTHEREMRMLQTRGWYNVRLHPLPQQERRGEQQPLWMLLAAVLVLLGIACLNVAGLQLARGLARTREFTVRAALGASRTRLAGQVLAENLMLAVVGGGLGVGLAEAALRVARRLAPPELPQLQTVGIHGVVLAAALGLTLLAGLGSGLAPAWMASRRRLAAAGTRVVGSASRLRPLLLVAELALALVLVVAAGLLARTFATLQRTDPGFEPRQAAVFELTLPSDAYAQPAAMVRFYHDVLVQLRRLPQVSAAGLAPVAPLGGATNSTTIRLPGRPPAPLDRLPFADYTVVSPGYFAAAGTPLLRGRDFSDADTGTSIPVAIISAAMARQYWPGQNPIGQQVGPASKKLTALTIVGVAADVKRQTLEDPAEPEMYVLYNQNPWPSMQTMDVVVRGRGDTDSLLGGLDAAVHRVDAQVPLARRTTLAALEQQALAGSDFLMLLMLAFGGIAAFTAMLGLYSVIAFEVQRRSPELAIRMALGATPQAVRRRVLRQGLGLAGVGIGCGLAAAWVLTRLMAGVLYGVSSNDAGTYLAAALLLGAVALAACHLPARRAARLDPLRVLRCE